MIYGQVLYKLGVLIESASRKMYGHDMRLDGYIHRAEMVGKGLIRKGQSIIARHADEIPF